MNMTLGTEDPELSQKGKNPAFHIKCLYFFKMVNEFVLLRVLPVWVCCNK